MASKVTDRMKEFPAVVMTISIGRFAAKELDTCQVRLSQIRNFRHGVHHHRNPLSSRLGLAGSHRPWQVHFDDHFVLAGSYFRSGDSETEDMAFAETPLRKDCSELADRPFVRSASDIGRVILAKGTRLHDHPPARLALIETNLRSHNCVVTTCEKGATYGDKIATHMELMKLAANQRDPKHLVDKEKKLMEHYGMGNPLLGSASCVMPMEYAEWHLNLTLSLPVARLFLQRASR
ncbi:hypothetical protein QFC22_006724 [Naganishia vaughanmartiniae]|uniref:Uncharacterized protein n=1 Tax=Naganishia vaughanmartiniae TaxID=1424756 RepID=A0ACC2WGB1_9TREE|nr:hypothetical protein QFC22_006724 [Naganishia vaughanmartiniae]